MSSLLSRRVETGPEVLHEPRRGLRARTTHRVPALTRSQKVSLGKFFRAQYNADAGRISELMLMYRRALTRDDVLLSCREQRTAALLAMQRRVSPRPDEEMPDDASESMIEAQLATARRAARQIDWTATIKALAEAQFFGFAFLEKHYAPYKNPDGTPVLDEHHQPIQNPDDLVVKLERVPQWHFAREDEYSEWVYFDDPSMAMGGRDGTEINPDHWVTREVDAHVCGVAARCWIAKLLADGQWHSFLQVFGVPSIFAIMPPNVPKDQEDEYLALAEQVVANSRGALPCGTGIETVGTGQVGQPPFESFLRYKDEQITRAACGGILTTLAIGDTGKLAGGAHQDTFVAICKGEADEIGQLITNCIIHHAIKKEHPGAPILVRWHLHYESYEERCQAAEYLAKLALAGWRPDADQVGEMVGIKVIDHGGHAQATAMGQATRVANLAHRIPDMRLRQTIVEASLRADRANLRPVASRLAAMLDMDAPSLRKAATDLIEVVQDVEVKSALERMLTPEGGGNG